MLPGSNPTRRPSFSQQSARSSGHCGSPPVENETPKKDSSKAPAPHDERDSGDVDGDPSDSQAGLSKEHISQPPELKRLVASSWADRHGTAIACAEITEQNPSTGSSVYHEHYSSDEEELACELGKVTTKPQLPGSAYKVEDADANANANADATIPASFSADENPQSITASSTSAHAATTVAAATRHPTATPHGRLFRLRSTAKRSNRVDVEDQLFETVKKAIVKKEQEDITESLKDISIQDDEEDDYDYDDELELLQVNHTANEFGIPEDCSLMQLASITPSPDVIRMQTSPYKTPPVKDSDMMQLSPKKTPSSAGKDVFRTVSMPSPGHMMQLSPKKTPSSAGKDVFRTLSMPSPGRNNSAQQHRGGTPVQTIPTQLKASSSTFSYPPPIFTEGHAGNASRAGDSTQQPRAPDRKAPPAPSPKINCDGDGAKGPFTLRPRGGIFKAMSSKRGKDSPAEYTMAFPGEKPTASAPASTASNEKTDVEPYEELQRATSPTINHPLLSPVSSGRHSSAFAPGVDVDRRTHPREHSPPADQQQDASTKKKSLAKKNVLTEI